MEKATVIALLEKYWQAETTVDEERALAAYFRGDGVDAELEAYADLFSYFQEEAQVSAGADFGNRILERLGLPLDEVLTTEAPVIPMAREPFRFGIVAAAAAIVLIVGGLFLLNPSTPAPQPRMLAETQTRMGGQAGSTDHAQVTDTYDDPEKALAAVRRALLVVSKNLNQGRREITGAHK